MAELDILSENESLSIFLSDNVHLSYIKAHKSHKGLS